MNWKSFFKPTIGKIIVTVLILVLFVPFIYYDTGIRCFMAPCPAGAYGSIIMWLIFSYDLYIYSVSYVNLILGSILAYLVSCVIIFVISKRKK